MQTRYNERNYPLLRFLKWEDSLLKHPEFKKIKDSPRRYVKGSGPFLEFNPGEIVRYARGDEDGITVRKELARQWGRLSPRFSSSIEVMSSTFVDAFIKAAPAFYKPDVVKDAAGEYNGTIIFPSGKAICYSFEMTNPHIVDGVLYYSTNGCILEFGPDGNRPVVLVANERAYYALEGRVVPRTADNPSRLFDLVITLNLFKKFAEVEVVDAKGCGRVPRDTPEVQTTSRNVRYLDASFYRTIVRKGDFKVSGHFRLQACGEGYKDRRLVYINEYVKHGYVRRAKILTGKD